MLYVFHLEEELTEIFDWERLGVNLIHAARYGLLNVLCFHMTCNGYDFGLVTPLYVVLLVELTNLLGRLVAIHERHVAVHKDEREEPRIALVKCLFDSIKCLFSVIGKLCQLVPIFHI